MATNSVQGKWDHVEEEEEYEEEEEEEEALSFCDLPVTLINCKDQHQSTKEDSQVNETSQEDFDFRSWGGLFSKEPEMCAADEVFFQGQILPLRLSFSSEAGLISKSHDGKQFNRSDSRSESLDHVSLSEFQSNSSRSSSVRSQNSSSSTSSTTHTTTPRISKPRFHGQFQTHPSPKPQLRVSGPRQSGFGNQGRKSKSSAWEFFRIGVVPAPEIGLQDLKVRSSTNGANKNCVSRNSSSSSSNSTSNGNNKSSVKRSNKTHHSDKSNHHVFKQFVGKGGGLLMSGCKCSVEAVRSDIVMIKGGSGTKSINKTESTTHAMNEKVVELKKQQKHRQKQGKKAMSRRRTFEWLKELHASHPDEEALLSNP